MPVSVAHSFLVQAGKGLDEQPDISGTKVKAGTKLAEMLAQLFAGADNECDIDIAFKPDAAGNQVNECQALLELFARAPTKANGTKIAKRLQGVTTHRSGLGLLFLVLGHDGKHQRLVVARFPADSGVIATERRSELTVEFIERVFMKNARAYKSVIYHTVAGFWDGKAVDKQVDGAREISEYWIGQFLASDLRTTGAAGSRRLAIAVRDAVRAANDDDRQSLIAAALAMRNFGGRVTSALRLATDLALPDRVAQAFKSAFTRPELYSERFRFEVDEFDDHLGFRSVELDNGATLIAENANFDHVFRRRVANRPDGAETFETTGRIVKERLRKKP